MERRAKLTGLDAPEKVQEVGPVSDAKATLLAKWNKMAERMRAAEIAAPMKDVTPLIEHEPSADAKTESVTKSVTKPVASVTKSPTAMTPVTKKRGRPAAVPGMRVASQPASSLSRSPQGQGLMSEPRARNSYRFEIRIFFRPRRSVDEPSRVRWWSRPSGSLFTKSVTKPVASVTKSQTAMTPVTKNRGRPAAVPGIRVAS